MEQRSTMFRRTLLMLGAGFLAVTGATLGMLFFRTPPSVPLHQGSVAGEEVHSQSVGTLFPHLKTWNIFLSVEGTGPEATFAGQHYDIAMGRMDKDTYYATNPNGNVCTYFHVPAGSPTQNLDDWIAITGYDIEDFMLHYTEDFYSTLHAENKLGWKQACSPSGCTPPATAANESQARMDDVGNTWNIWNLEDSRFKEYATWLLKDLFFSFTPIPSKCIMLDTIPFFSSTLGLLGFEKSDVYPGIPTNNSHPFIARTFTWGVEFINYLQSQYGITVFGVPNMTASSVNNAEPYKSLVEQYYDWSLIENWVAFPNSDTAVSGVSPTSYEQDYQHDVVQILAQNAAGEKRLVRGFELYGRESDRGKIFVLANFYLINNPNAYFSYNVFNAPGADDIPSKKWYNAMGYDIGLPIPNQTTGGPDYAGNTGTTEHYEWASGTDPSNPAKTYHIFARDYSNALVLLKYKPQGNTEGAGSATTHALNGTFRPLNVDGTLGAPVTQVTLRNNEAVILLRETPIDALAPNAVTNLLAQ